MTIVMVFMSKRIEFQERKSNEPDTHTFIDNPSSDFSLITSRLLARAGYLGGQIWHTEINSNPALSPQGEEKKKLITSLSED